MFKWLCRHAERPSDIPVATLRAAIAGALLGPFISVLFNWLSHGSWDDFLGQPFEWLAISSLIGAIFSTTFYIVGGVPWIFIRPYMCRLPKWSTWPVAISICGIGGAIGALLSIRCAEAVLGHEIVPPHQFSRTIVADSLIAIVIGLFIGNIRRLQMERNIREQALRETAAKAQAYALQAQIAPHFFFNTLNSISALIPVRPDAAQQALWELADIFRYTFACGRDETVTLDKELQFVRRYLALEQVRYGDRLHFELPVPDCAASVRLPGLTLQPLVENAVRHGIATRLEGGTIRVEVEAQNGDCRIAVWNQFDPVDGPPDLHNIFDNGHALGNIRERLKLVYGEHAGISVDHAGDEWVCATLRVPSNGAALSASTGR